MARRSDTVSLSSISWGTENWAATPPIGEQWTLLWGSSSEGRSIVSGPSHCPSPDRPPGRNTTGLSPSHNRSISATASGGRWIGGACRRSASSRGEAAPSRDWVPTDGAASACVDSLPALLVTPGSIASPVSMGAFLEGGPTPLVEPGEGVLDRESRFLLPRAAAPPPPGATSGVPIPLPTRDCGSDWPSLVTGAARVEWVGREGRRRHGMWPPDHLSRHWVQPCCVLLVTRDNLGIDDRGLVLGAESGILTGGCLRAPGGVLRRLPGLFIVGGVFSGGILPGGLARLLHQVPHLSCSAPHARLIPAPRPRNWP